ncbi:ABC transporter permease [Salidesulfovibrio brasiliensis]|uniref:ABC transporter permease n=1 Tax=Salidesulfovibrio brasiliensis TaxID=221711 RepID=UPI0006D235A0|nr:ABC transporter permease [Salidesulfovibrio brasiliensis]
MNGVWAVFYREMLLLRRRKHRFVASITVTPLLYLLAFNYAADGADVNGVPYVSFLVVGLAAMTCMMQGYSIGSEINVARFYWKIFEEVQCSPVSGRAYVLGETLAGSVRALISVMVVVAVGIALGAISFPGPLFWFAVFLLGTVFSSLAVWMAMVVRGHQDQMMLSTFVITPMAFLGGTFFPVDRLPQWAQWVVEWLPISLAADAMRASALDLGVVGWSAPTALLVMAGIFYHMACRSVSKSRM